MKKIIFISFIFLTVIFIYKSYSDSEFVSVIGDNYYTEYQSKKNYIIYLNSGDYRIIDLKNDINNNVDIMYNTKTLKLQHVLVKSKKLIITIGMNELNYFNTQIINNKYKYIDEVIQDYNELFDMILLLDKEQIYFVDNSEIINNCEYKKYYQDKLHTLLDKKQIELLNFTNQ